MNVCNVMYDMYGEHPPHRYVCVSCSEWYTARKYCMIFYVKMLCEICGKMCMLCVVR